MEITNNSESCSFVSEDDANVQPETHQNTNDIFVYNDLHHPTIEEYLDNPDTVESVSESHEEPINMSSEAYTRTNSRIMENRNRLMYDTIRFENERYAAAPVTATSAVNYPEILYDTWRNGNSTVNPYAVAGLSTINYPQYNTWGTSNSYQMPPAVEDLSTPYRQFPLAQPTYRPVPVDLSSMDNYPSIYNSWRSRNEPSMDIESTPAAPNMCHSREIAHNIWDRYYQPSTPGLSYLNYSTEMQNTDYSTSSIRNESYVSAMAARSNVRRPTAQYPTMYYPDGYNTWMTRNEPYVAPAAADFSTVLRPSSIASTLNYPSGCNAWRTANESYDVPIADRPNRTVYKHPIYVPPVVTVPSSTLNCPDGTVRRRKTENTIHLPPSAVNALTTNDHLGSPYNTLRSEFQSVSSLIAVNPPGELEEQSYINENVTASSSPIIDPLRIDTSDEEIIVTLPDKETDPIEDENISCSKKNEKDPPSNIGPSSSIVYAYDNPAAIAGPFTEINVSRPAAKRKEREPANRKEQEPAKRMEREPEKPSFSGDYKENLDQFIQCAKFYFVEMKTPPNMRVPILETMFQKSALVWFKQIDINNQSEEKVYQHIRNRFMERMTRLELVNVFYNDYQKENETNKDFITRKMNLHNMFTPKPIRSKYIEVVRSQLRPKNQHWSMNHDIKTIDDLLVAATVHDDRLTVIRSRRAVRLAATAGTMEAAEIDPQSEEVIPQSEKAIPRSEEVIPELAEEIPESSLQPSSCKFCNTDHPQGKSYILAKIYASKKRKCIRKSFTKPTTPKKIALA